MKWLKKLFSPKAVEPTQAFPRIMMIGLKYCVAIGKSAGGNYDYIDRNAELIWSSWCPEDVIRYCAVDSQYQAQLVLQKYQDDVESKTFRELNGSVIQK